MVCARGRDKILCKTNYEKLHSEYPYPLQMLVHKEKSNHMFYIFTMIRI